jgi:trans-aconitate methyltransferase
MAPPPIPRTAPPHVPGAGQQAAGVPECAGMSLEPSRRARLGSSPMDYDFTPESYVAMMREAVPGYDRLEEEVAAATGTGAQSVLELGTGTGETARRVLDRHPDAQLIGIDASPGMVKVARESLPTDRVRLLVGRLEDPLPEGPFDLVVSCLAVHHLAGTSKADLFRRIAGSSPQAAALSSPMSWSRSIPRT